MDDVKPSAIESGAGPQNYPTMVLLVYYQAIVGEAIRPLLAY